MSSTAQQQQQQQRIASQSYNQPGTISGEVSTPTITNIKIPNFLPSPQALSSLQRPSSFSSTGSTSSIPPPPPPPPPPLPPPSHVRSNSGVGGGHHVRSNSGVGGHVRSNSGVGGGGHHARSNSGVVGILSHARSESGGSMSSLGSSGGIGNRNSNRDLRDSIRSTGSNEGLGVRQEQFQDTQSQLPTQQEPNQRRRSKGSMASVSFETPPQPSQRKTVGNIAPTGSFADAVSTPEALREAVTHTRKNSFLDMLRLHWSPQSQAVERKKPTVDDFHRRNQEFLQSKQRTATSFSAVPDVSQAPHHRRLGSQDRPPPSWGSHRRLSSIPQHPEGWTEGDDSNSMDSLSSDGDKKPRATSGGSAGTNSRPPPPPPPPAPAPSSRSTAATATSVPSQQSIGANPSFETNESNSTPDSQYRYTDDEEEENRNYSEDDDDADEKTSLLPAAGISTNEQDGKRSLYDHSGSSDNRFGSNSYTGKHRSATGRREDARYDPSPRSEWSSDSSRALSPHEAAISTDRWDNRTAKLMSEAEENTKKSRKKKYRRRTALQATVPKGLEGEDDDDSDEEETDMDYRVWTMKRATMLERERSKMIEQWKEEARAEAELLRKEEEGKEPHMRCWGSVARFFADLGGKSFRCLTLVEMFIANLPLTIGAVAMAVVTLGVVWFKFAEEFLSTCEPVHFHSSQCTFPEFPGCFYCDQTVIGYKIALGFHYGCKVTAGFLAMLVVMKVLLATRVVMDEMSSPTTSSPAGLMCMTACVVYAGRGVVGQVMVTIAAFGHLCLVIWFIYMALAYRIMPEPSWFPNTIGIGLSAVKTWLYYPMPGHLLMAISLLLNFFFFPISLIRVAANKKISATVGWMQMSAPAIALYSLTIMAQPSFEEEQPDVTNFQRVHRMVYLPCMHVMCALTIVGMGASIHSLWVRWADFSKRSFSPAHAAFAFPTLSHANAIQAYRGAVMSFSGIPSRTWPFFILDAYWLIVLIGGTVATFWICGKFLYHLPEWTAPDLMDEEEPPAPYDTLLSQKDMVTVGDHLTQPFVSPAIIQANETGALVMARNLRDGSIHYVRTRRIGALGFEPTMNWNEMQEEAEALLDWVGKHPPRRRHRTLSVPGIDFTYGGSTQPFGTGNTGVYGTMSSDTAHNRHMTLGANDTRILF
jgi:hypothetical protein